MVPLKRDIASQPVQSYQAPTRTSPLASQTPEQEILYAEASREDAGKSILNPASTTLEEPKVEAFPEYKSSVAVPG